MSATDTTTTRSTPQDCSQITAQYTWQNISFLEYESTPHTFLAQKKIEVSLVQEMIYARRVELHVVDLTIISKIFITITITSGYISLYGIKGLYNF